MFYCNGCSLRISAVIPLRVQTLFSTTVVFIIEVLLLLDLQLQEQCGLQLSECYFNPNR